MQTARPGSSIVRFGVFEVDLEAGELRKSGMRQKLVGQPLHVLLLLLEHPQQIVTREELKQHIWPHDTYVDYDLALKKVINKVREALGDSAESPRFIETIPRRGYRFIAPVTVNGDAGEMAEPPAVKKASRRALQIGIALGLAAPALLFAALGFMPSDSWHRLFGKTTTPQIRSIAVLPLQNLSADPAQEYFSDGLTDALITDLAQIGTVRVVSRTSSMEYKQTKKTLPEIARELKVDGIVEGSVQRSGDRVRITAQLIYTPADKHMWASSYEGDMRDVFALEREVTGDIAHQVQAHVTAQKEVGVAQPKPVNPEVLEAYLQGEFHLRIGANRSRDEEFRKAAEYFQRAIHTDPTFAPAFIGLAEAHNVLWWPSTEDFAMMRTAAQRALELAPGSSDAHEIMAETKFEDRDWAGAEEEFRRAIELNPSNASAHYWLGASLDITGRMEEGWKEFQIAQEVDPNQDHLSDALYRRGEYNRAVDLLLRTAELNPEDSLTHWFLSENYARQGRQKEWVQEVGTMAIIFGFPEVADRLQHAFATSGYTGALRQWATETERGISSHESYFPGVLAQTYTELGDRDRAFYWLEQGCQHYHQAISDPVLQWVKVDPGFASLHSDPRFNSVLRCMGLPQ